MNVVADPRTGTRMMALTERASPVLKLLLPGQDESARGIEVELPEHVWGRPRGASDAEQLYLMAPGRQEDQGQHSPHFTWHCEGRALGYQMEVKQRITMNVRAEMEPDGIRMQYRFINNGRKEYSVLQPVTCVKLNDPFTDNFLERTYVHHADGFDLLASETPERLQMSRDQWLPCRYLVSFTWPPPSPDRRIETVEGIRRYNKSVCVDEPVLATLSHDEKWIAATCTRETGNLWTNPERTCQHADPTTELKPGDSREVALKLFLFRGTLNQLLERVRHERGG